MIWGYRNSLKAWQLWNMKKPHHIKGCEINFSAEIIWNKIKTPLVLSHLCQNLVCWLISCVTKRKCRWKLRIVEQPLDIFSASANCPLDTNFTFRTLRTELLSAIDTHSPLYVTQLHTVQCFYISRLTHWHRLYIQNFAYRSLEHNWHKLQTLYFSTAPQRKCSRF